MLGYPLSFPFSKYLDLFVKYRKIDSSRPKLWSREPGSRRNSESPPIIVSNDRTTKIIRSWPNGKSKLRSQLGSLVEGKFSIDIGKFPYAL